MEEALTGLLIGILVAVGIFLITREFWCWYFKINKTLGELNMQNQMLAEQNATLRRQTLIMAEWAKQEGVRVQLDEESPSKRTPSRQNTDSGSEGA